MLSLTSSEQLETTTIWFARGANRPGESTYNIHSLDYEDMDLDEWIFDFDYFVVFCYIISGDEMEFYVSDTGSISFEQSTPESLAGNFDFSAIGFNITKPDEEIQVEFKGGFNAMFVLPDDMPEL